MKRYFFLVMFVAMISLLLTTSIVFGQARYEAKSGANNMSVVLVNRSDQEYAQLKVRFASDKPSWILSTGEMNASLHGFRNERAAKDDALRLELPFVIAQLGYFDADVKFELVNNKKVMGTFNVFFDFDGISARLASSSNGASGITLVEGVDIPTEYALRQNFPNPFNPTTMIQFELPEISVVDLKVYDMLGREITTLVHDSYEPGTYRVQWDGKDGSGVKLSSGIYFYRLSTDSYGMTRRMMLLQ